MTDSRPLPDALRAAADRVAEAVSALLPAAPPDLRARLESVIDATLSRLDLVPREEYERQLAALARLEDALRRVEARLAVLEAQAPRGSDPG
jgi:BMFP domain-containing protein YqiC